MASKDSSPETAESELDDGALDAIRSILTEETKPEPRRGLSRRKAAPIDPQPEVSAPPRKASVFPELESAETASESLAEVPKQTRRKFSLGGVSKRRAAKKQKVAPVRAPQPEAVVPNDGIVAKIKAYRPKPAHIVLGALALVVIMRPWLVIGLVVLSLLILVGVFLIAGYDGFWQGVMKIGRWYADRRPARAAVLHARLDRFAVRWDAILDRFPEGSVDGLYLPDFGDLATAEDRHAEAMERRLSGLHENGA